MFVPPPPLREKYGIDPGDTVRWEDTDEGIVVRTVVRDAGHGTLVGEGLDRVAALARLAEVLALHEARDGAVTEPAGDGARPQIRG